jgi:hypothetical protein
VTRQPWPTTSSTIGEGLPSDAPAVAIAASVLCTLSNEDAMRSLVTGADGGSSVMMGNTTWWLFGDTIFHAESGKQIEPNSVASSTEARPDGCPRLEYVSTNGIAVPFIEKDGALTVWPTAAWPKDDDSFYFYTAYVYGSGPYSYSVNDIGLGAFNTTTREVTILARRLWDAESGFASRVLHVQPVELDAEGQLRLVLHTETTAKLLARAELARLDDPTAYEYWDGRAWSDSAAEATALWQVEAAASDVAKLVQFENGASISWNDYLNKYVALVNVGFDSVGARTADQIEGPWSEPVAWLNCLAFARPRVPACYSPQQHPAYNGDDGKTIHATISAIEPYETQFVEITLGRPVHEYTLDSAVRYSVEPLEGWKDEGVAFYASNTEHDDFATVYAWERGDEVRYAATSPGDGFAQKEPAFYAPSTAASPDRLINYRPVYDWANGRSHILSPLETGLEEHGYKRRSVMFYTP